MSESRLHVRILRAAVLLVVAGITIAALLAHRAVQQTARTVGEEEAAMAASLWELFHDRDPESTITSLLGDRFTIDPAGAEGPDARVRVPLYRPGGMEPVAQLALEPPLASRSSLIVGFVLALLGAALVWQVAASVPAAPRWAQRTVAASLLVLPALAAGASGSWANGELGQLSTDHLTQSARTYDLARTTGRPQAAMAARTPWLPRESLGSDEEQWTLPPALAAAVPATWSGEGTVVAAGVPYVVMEVGDAVLARTSYQATNSVGIPMAAAALATILIAGLVLSLTSLAGRPRLLRRDLVGWAFLTPAATHLLFFTFGPLLFSLWLSLHDWSLVDQAHPFVGLAQYTRLATDGEWWSAVWNTVVFTLHVPIAMAVALALALLTRGSQRSMRWARLALFLPSVTSIVAIAIVWKWLLNDNYGLVNDLLGRFGLGPVAWLTSPDTALVTLMLVGIWLVVGYQMVVFQAGLASIPRDWYDAARVDGAGRWRTLWHITLPGLRKTLFFVLITSVIGSFQVFGLVYVMTEGGPLGATDVAVYHIYREAWEYLQFGSAAAMSWIFFAVVFAATWLHFRVLDKSQGAAHA